MRVWVALKLSIAPDMAAADPASPSRAPTGAYVASRVVARKARMPRRPAARTSESLRSCRCPCYRGRGPGPATGGRSHVLVTQA